MTISRPNGKQGYYDSAAFMDKSHSNSLGKEATVWLSGVHRAGKTTLAKYLRSGILKYLTINGSCVNKTLKLCKLTYRERYK